MFTTFVALQDVAPHHGPTRFLPRTHAAFLGTGAHRDFSGDEPRFYERVKSVSAILGVGDCTLYDRFQSRPNLNLNPNPNPNPNTNPDPSLNPNPNPNL